MWRGQRIHNKLQWLLFLPIMLLCMCSCNPDKSNQDFITIIVEQDDIATEYVFDGADRIHDMAWSPDGEQIALGTSGGLWLYDTDDLSHYRLLSACEPLDVHRIAFSHDGQYVAANSVHTILEPECLAPRCRYQGTLFVWNRMSGKLIGEWVHGYYYSGLVTPHFTFLCVQFLGSSAIRVDLCSSYHLRS